MTFGFRNVKTLTRKSKVFGFRDTCFQVRTKVRGGAAVGGEGVSAFAPTGGGVLVVMLQMVLHWLF